MSDQALTLEQLQLLAGAAGAAPSIHNSRPRRFRLPPPDADGLVVYGDPQRAVRLTDLYGRALHVSAGAAVFNLRVAAARPGRDPRVPLPPDRADSHLLAVADLSLPVMSPDPFGRDLYPAVRHRHSGRQPFANRDVPEAVFGGLITACVDGGVLLSLLEEAGVRRVLSAGPGGPRAGHCGGRPRGRRPLPSPRPPLCEQRGRR
ncbi:hypothetical protein [Kitasatospora sp. NPDC051914]|uniref:hypothetical protein n=1 Tax=Kitasatospora sp. NPDC051914 TaxID=3154945 RepID=UPI00342113D3